MAASEDRWKTKFDEIFEILVCSVCPNFAKPPVKQCTQGHICCHDCGESLTDCPTCGEAFVRNNTAGRMNKIVGIFVKRCPFRRYGCPATLTNAEYEDHVEACPLRRMLCKICYKYVAANNLRSHVIENHKDRTFTGEKRIVKFENFNLEKNSQSTEIISAFEEIFWYCFSYDSLDRSFNFAVQFIGPKLGAARYVYEIVTHPGNKSDNKSSFKRTTHHHHDSVKFTLINHGIWIKQSSLAQDRSFLFHVNIYKRNEEPIVLLAEN